MDRYRQIVELSEDCIKEIDLEGVVVAVNGKGLKLLGAEHPSQVISKSWRDLWPEESRLQIDEAIRSAKNGVQVQFEACCPNFLGADRVWNVRVSPVVVAGHVASILAVSTDVTGRNSALLAAQVLQSALDAKSSNSEEQLAAAERREARLVEELRASQSRLIATNTAYQELEVEHFKATQGLDFAVAAQLAAQMIADQAQKGEIVGQLLAGVVHDLNNFLQSATSAIDVVMDSGELGATNARLLRIAEFALQQGAEMSQRLVGFAREHPYTPEPVKLAGLIELMEPLLSQAVGKRANLIIDSGEAGCCAMVDRNTLERALLNLVVNARDACTGFGEIKIKTGRVTISPEESTANRISGEYVTLTVSDNGAGMSEEVMARIFDVYFTTKPPGEGSGLGLPQVHNTVRQAGGFVTIKSAPNLGATFQLAFPKVDPDHSGEGELLG